MPKTLKDKIQTAIEALESASAELEKQVETNILDRAAAHILIVPAQQKFKTARNAYFKKMKNKLPSAMLILPTGKPDFARMDEDFAGDVEEDELFKKLFPSSDRFGAALQAFAAAGGCKLI